MALPESRQSKLIQYFIEYLTQETSGIEPDLNWNQYDLTIAPTDPPKGAVYLPNWMPTNQANLDIDETDYQIIVRLLFGAETFSELLEKAHAWGGFLTHKVIKKLGKEGYTINDINDSNNGQIFFQGLLITQKPTIAPPEKNQDGGAKTSLVIPCVWHDLGGTVSGIDMQFL